MHETQGFALICFGFLTSLRPLSLDISFSHLYFTSYYTLIKLLILICNKNTPAVADAFLEELAGTGSIAIPQKLILLSLHESSLLSEILALMLQIL